jgi:hypothetical protein
VLRGVALDVATTFAFAAMSAIGGRRRNERGQSRRCARSFDIPDETR